MPNYEIFRDPTSQTGALTVTSTNTYYSKALAVDGRPVGFHFAWTETVAALTGAFTLWYSNKPDANPANDTDWVQDTAFPAPTVSGSGKGFVSASQVCALLVRVKYVNATGTGTLRAWGQLSTPS